MTIFLTMKKTIQISAFLLAASVFYTACCPKPCPPCLTCETFDGMPLAQYGKDAGGVIVNPPGSLIFSIVGSVPVRIQNFNYSGGTSYGFARIEPAVSFGSGKVINTNNVCLEFDFSGNNIKEISIEFRDMGGTENLAVNGSVYTGELTAVPATLGGAGVKVTSSPVTGGKIGKVTLKSVSGSINTVLIGGQEFHLDNLCYQ